VEEDNVGTVDPELAAIDDLYNQQIGHPTVASAADTVLESNKSRHLEGNFDCQEPVEQSLAVGSNPVVADVGRVALRNYP
jgi:hypothetical protein